MEEILKDLIASSSKHKQSVPRQFYFNLGSSSRNWNEPTGFHMLQRLKQAQANLQQHFQKHGEFQSGLLNAETSKNEEEILTPILALDIYHNCHQLSAIGEEEYPKLKSLLAEFITPVDGISMQDFSLYKNAKSNPISNLTSLAISVLLETGKLAEPPARTIAELLKEEMLQKFESISEDSAENCDIDAVECCNLLRLLYQLDMSGNMEEIQDFLYAYLDNRIYEDDEDSIVTYSPDAFLYFLTRAVVCSASVEELFRDLLLERIMERLGQGFGFKNKEEEESFPVIDLSMRLVSLQCLGIFHEKSSVLRCVMAGEVKTLLKWQREDGSWGPDRICKIQGEAFGGAGISSLFAMFALSFICEYK